MRVYLEKRLVAEPPCRPFLRWAGGKQKLTKQLLRFVPPATRYHSYFEPFVGAGALFFAIGPTRAVLGDVNEELVNCYHQVAKAPLKIATMVEALKRNDSRDFYYAIRERPCSQLSTLERAARFIYLNKAAFNGIYRVNKQGRFNVPYGPSLRGPAIPRREQLFAAAKKLRNANIVAEDFQELLTRTKAGDFIYLDPPYLARSRTAFFAHYSSKEFGWDEHLRVARTFIELHEKGCLVMLSNSGHNKAAALYSDFFVSRLNAIRWVGSNGDRFRAREIVVTNYDPARIHG